MHPHHPDRSYHNIPLVSHNRHVNAPSRTERVVLGLVRFMTWDRSQKSGSQPCGVVSANAKCVTKDTSLVSSAWMGGIEAIVLEFADIANCLIAVR